MKACTKQKKIEIKIQNLSLGGGELWWPSLISYHVVGNSGWLPLKKITKIATKAPPFKIETCNKNHVLLSLSQFTCQPSYQATIIKIPKSYWPSCQTSLHDSHYPKSQDCLARWVTT